VILARAGVRWLVLGFHTYLYSLCYFCDHAFKNIKFFYFSTRLVSSLTEN
jgi:hypothetical protein